MSFNQRDLDEYFETKYQTEQDECPECEAEGGTCDECYSAYDDNIDDEFEDVEGFGSSELDEEDLDILEVELFEDDSDSWGTSC